MIKKILVGLNRKGTNGKRPNGKGVKPEKAKWERSNEKRSNRKMSNGNWVKWGITLIYRVVFRIIRRTRNKKNLNLSELPIIDRLNLGY